MAGPLKKGEGSQTGKRGMAGENMPAPTKPPFPPGYGGNKVTKNTPIPK